MTNAQQRSGLFCIHLSDRILACAEKYGTPMVRQCFDGENSFAERLPSDGMQSGREQRARDGAFSDVDFSQHRSYVMLVANRERLERARVLREQHGRIRAGRGERLSLRAELKRAMLLDGSADGGKADTAHAEAAYIRKVAAQHAHTCEQCLDVYELLQTDMFWFHPDRDTEGDDGESETTADCVIVMQDIASDPPAHILASCKQTRWKLAVILTQFGVLALPRPRPSSSAHGEKTSPKTPTPSHEPVWNVAMIITLPRQERFAIPGGISTLLQHSEHSREIRQSLLRHSSVFASACIYLNRGVLALRMEEPFVGARKCPESIGAVAPMCT